MATTTLTNEFKRSVMRGKYNLPSDTLKWALYSGSGHNEETDQYSSTNESSGTGYTAGGKAATNVILTVTNVFNAAYIDMDDVQWASSSITATDALLYDDTITSDAPTPAKASISVHDFGGSRTTNSGTFSLVMPSANFNTAIVRIV